VTDTGSVEEEDLPMFREAVNEKGLDDLGISIA
jgi:hypothetical protein